MKNIYAYIILTVFFFFSSMSMVLSATNPSHFTGVKSTPESCVYAGKVVINGVEAIDNEDEVGVYVNDGESGEILVGSCVIGQIMENVYYVNVYGDDITTKNQKDGAYRDDVLVFKVWDKSEGKEYVISEELMSLEPFSTLTLPIIPPKLNPRTTFAYLHLEAISDCITVYPLPDITVKEDFQYTVVNLSEIFQSTCNSTIDYSISSNTNNSLLNATIEKDKLNIYSEKDRNGSTSIIIVAISDGKKISDDFNIIVTSVNDPPTANNIALTTSEDKIVTEYFSAYDVDNDPLTYSVVEQATKGIVTIIDSNTGHFKYTPYPIAIGNDIFYFKVNDGLLDSKASVEIIIEKEPELCEASMNVPSNKKVSYNSIFTFPISISQSCLIEGIDLYINYDPNLLSLSKKIASLNIDIFSNYELTINSNEPGELMISIYGNSDLISASGNFVNIEFIASGKSNDNGTITLSKAFINNKEIDTTSAVMKIEILKYFISGRVKYFTNQQEEPLVIKPIPRVIMTLMSDHLLLTTTTDEQGLYTFSELEPDLYTITANKFDDLNGLDPVDASNTARYSVGLHELDCMQKLASDVVLDNIILSIDASRIARHGIGLRDTLNDENINWIFMTDIITDCAINDCDYLCTIPLSYTSNRQINLVNNIVNQDFIGIRLGDVNGSWSNVNTDNQNLKSSIPPELTVEVNNQERLVLPVGIADILNMEGLFMDIKYNENSLRPIRAYFGDSKVGYHNYALLMNNKINGEIKISVFAQTDIISIVDEILYLEFEVIGNKKSNIWINEFRCNNMTLPGGFIIDNEYVKSLQISPSESTSN